MDFEEEVLLLAAANEEEQRELLHQRNRRKNQWVHEINQTRLQEGEFHTLYKQLRMDEKRFYIYFRMNFECFDEILARIENDIRKQHSKFREPIEPAERLAVTLRFLATGDSYKTIGHSFRMGFSTVSKIVEEVCCAIFYETTTNLYARTHYRNLGNFNFRF
ncbi:uncharacterized protein [Leptinotarsa decemlineata]|uniref:uncharacterized protein n=1 Tax=Leptinotarsa decemlineata TaxID=7539 RepID=UPI003D306936